MRRPQRLILLACLGGFACQSAAAEDIRAARRQAILTSPIRGVCGEARLSDAVARGANAVRTYATPTRADLDRLQAAGVRAIPGIWMPHEGANKAKEGGTWNFSYARGGPKMLAEFAAALDRVGDHPAILMWTLGNEVRLEPEYLRQVERMSRLVHERFPKVLTSLTIINAPAESLRLIREHAPDIDVVGVNAYGQGAIANAIRSLDEHWGGPFYFSEFNATGPWWGPQASWGPRFEPSAPRKVDEIARAWGQVQAAENSAGGCLFQWGLWQRERITYFSGLLPADPFQTDPPDADLRFTPVADELARQWSGRPPERQAPVLERVTIDGQAAQDIVVGPGAILAVSAAARDPDTPPERLRYRWWIAQETGGRLEPVAGPVESATPAARIQAPSEPDQPLMLLCLVLDDGDGICGTTLPFRTAQ